MVFPAFYPLVQLFLTPDKYARTPFGANGPQGVTIHYTADPSVEAALASFGATGYCYHLLIDRDGKVTQACYMNRTVWHAGKALWNGKSPNKAHIAVAVVSWGSLDPDGKGGWKSYADTEIPVGEVETRPNNVNGKMEAWHKATPAQEDQLEQILRWCMAHGITAENICGHDEAALPLGRKDDPGGVLSLTMPQLRAKLKAVPATS